MDLTIYRDQEDVILIPKNRQNITENKHVLFAAYSADGRYLTSAALLSGGHRSSVTCNHRTSTGCRISAGEPIASVKLFLLPENGFAPLSFSMEIPLD